MTLAIDSYRTHEHRACDQCGRGYEFIRGFILNDDDAYAIYFAACHDHDGTREAWIDVILGTFTDENATDHVTFGCRVGHFPGQVEPAASAVHAAQPYCDRPIWGRKLTREEALAHPWAAAFWEVVDFVLLNDSTVEHHLRS